VVEIDNTAISLVACYKEKEGYILRFVNNNEGAQTTTLTIMGKTYTLTFGKYEAKTYYFDGELTEKKVWC
jgi:hypothetical protein